MQSIEQEFTEQELTLINSSKLPPTGLLQLKTRQYVWGIVLGDKLGNGTRGIVWRAEAKGRKSVSGALKVYQNDTILQIDKNRDAKDIVDRNIQTHQYLKKSGIPTLSFFRRVNDTNVFMNDLTENGKYWITGATSWDPDIKMPSVGIQRVPIIGNKYLKKQNLFIYDTVRQKMRDLAQKLVSNGVEIQALDAYFVRVKKTKKPLTSNDIEILVCDLDNVSIAKSGIGFLSEEADYISYKLIAKLLQR